MRVSHFLYFSVFGISTILFKKKRPILGTIILTDDCNLSCKHCAVNNIKKIHYSYGNILKEMQSLYCVEEIRALIKKGYPVFNLSGSLDYFLKNNWARPCYQCVVMEQGKRYNIGEEKSDWMVIDGVFTNYVKLNDINPAAVPEIKLGFSMDATGYIFKETADGLLCGNMVSPETSPNAQDIKKIPQIRKLDKTGKTIWKKEYDYQTYSGKVNNLVVSPDGGFIFSAQTHPYVKDNGLVWGKSCLIKCDQNGKELWKRDFDDYAGGLLRHLFITENDEIIKQEPAQR